MVEEWKTVVIDGEVFEDYEVSNTGKVRSFKHGKIKEMKLCKDKNGYLRIGLRKKNKKKLYMVHRLVAFVFIENDDPINKTQVNHIDENKQNNNIENLEWCSPKYNVNYGTCQERRSKKVSETMKKKYEDGYVSPTKDRQKTDKQKEQFTKLRETQKGDNHPKARKVLCVETGQVFGCVKDAGEWCGLKNECSISTCCKGKQKTAGGYHWMYLDDYLTESK